MASAGRLWWLLRRDLRRGWRASVNDYRTLPLIAEWEAPSKLGEGEVPVHFLTGAHDWRLAAWMLASWVEATEQTWPLILHDDGTLPAEAAATFCRLFPELQIIARADADRQMVGKLAPRCAAYRARHPLGLKIFDMPALCSGARFIVLDSDVLFFHRPTEILDWAAAGPRECWFNQDVAETSLVTAAECAALGVKLWPAVNSGLCLLVRDAIDFDFCERVLAQTQVEQGHIWRLEQTLFALCASKFGAGGLLPRTYEVSLGKTAAPGAIARHYVGGVRDRFYGEGLHVLAPRLLRRA